MPARNRSNGKTPLAVSGWGTAYLLATFAVVMLALTAGYVVFRTYTPPPSAAPPITPEVRQFTLRMQRTEAGEKTVHHWMPSVLVVNVGDSVILKVTNGDPETSHGFVLSAFNISVPAIAPGQTETFRFRAGRPGVYHYGCSLTVCAPDHADQTGQFVVLGNP